MPSHDYDFLIIVSFAAFLGTAIAQTLLQDQQPIQPQPLSQYDPNNLYGANQQPNYGQSPAYGSQNTLGQQPNYGQTLNNYAGQTGQFDTNQYGALGGGNVQSSDGSLYSGYDQSNRNYNAYGINNIDGIDENDYCPEFWIAHKKVCYRFHKSPKRNWHEAKKLCKAMNAELVNVDTVDKHSFILTKLIVEDQRQNRYFVSARQLSPNSWTNDDNTPLINVDDSIVYEETELDPDTLQENLDANRYMNPQYPQRYGGIGGIGGIGGTSRLDNPLLRFERTRLVYGFSNTKNRWALIPSYEFEQHLFICESSLLYNPNNINILQDDKRGYDYGVIITDERRIPRGPYFVKQPRDTTFDTGKRTITNDVTISCLANGYPTPDYSWYKEEYVNDNLTFYRISPLEDSRYTISGGNLIIYNPEQTRDQGTYHCIAENKFGRIRSESVGLNFGYIMEFNLKRSAESGDSNWGKSLFCDPPQHYPGVKYYWSRDFFPNFVEEDQRVFVSNDGALYFSALEVIDRANYSCTVQSLVSSTGRNGPFFPLRVKPHPNYQALLFANSFPKVFPEAPVAGEEIRLECVAFGYPVPSYNWTRKAIGLPRHAYQINYNRVLIIPNATLNDNGEYICTTKNDRKTLQKSILINIQMKPNFTIPLRDKIKDFKSEVSFVCEVNAIPDVNYTWYKNAELMDREQLDRDKYVIQDNVLSIKFLDPDKDDGMYQCRAQNALKAVYSSGQLRVLSMKPSFAKYPLESEIYAIYNGNTTIVCNPEAAPRPKFQWKKDGNIIGAGGHRRILPTGTLIVSPTSRDDEGVYSCVATNAYGTDESKARVIVLQELRFIRTLPATIYHQIYDLLYLHCDVSYDEVLDVAFIWKHNGQIMQDKENGRIVVDYNSLEVHNVTMLDSGEYECIAKSSVNEISTKTLVTVAGPPGAPGGVKVIDILKTTARLEWIDGANNGRPTMYYNILGRTNWNKTWVNVSEGVPAYEVDRYTGRKQAEVIGLTPWSGYEFSVCAVNDLGIGAPSAPSPLYNTHTDKPYLAPKNVGGGGGKIGDLTMTWKALLSEEQNAHGIHYKIFWRLHAKNSEWASQILKEYGNVNMAVVQIPLDNYYTRYDVKVQAINDIGLGPESRVAVIYTAEDMPQVAPQQPIARGFNSTSINVTWNAVEQTREKIRGNLIGHRLKYWKKDMREEDSVYYLSRTTRNWALIVGLEPDTYYLVKVMAYNAAGEGPESERYLERTYRKAPQKPPSSVHVYGINPSTVRVVWRYVGVTLEEEPIQGYKVRVWETDQDMSRANDSIIEIGNKLECYVSNLTPGKSYKMRVLAFSNGGDGRMSSPTLNFQMGKTTPNAAVHLKLNKTILFGWLAVFYLFKMTYF